MEQEVDEELSQTSVHVTADLGNGIVGENIPSANVSKKKKKFTLSEKISRKRPRNEDEWKKKRAALAREQGKAYITYKGKEMPAKEVNLGNLCNENCRLRCGEKLDSESRTKIHTSFYKLDINAKNALLFKSIEMHETKRQRKNARRHKSASYKYVITCNGKLHYICKTALCSLHGIGRKKIDLLQQQLKDGKSAPSPDLRGRHNARSHRIEEEVVNFVKRHIESFPAEESHYSRNKNPHKLFLSPMLSISKMYRLYLQKLEEERKPQNYKVKKCTYAKIFSTCYNYSFGAPRSDTCSTCDSGMDDAEHKENYEEAYQLQRIDRQNASNNPQLMYLTIDLQQTMPLPKLTTSKAFYLRQMWFYNLGIHSISTKHDEPFFFTWTEDVAGRGSQEVTSALCTFIEMNQELFKDKDHLVVWTDSCAGQNKNFQMICLYQYFVLKGIFSVIDHKFPEVGHSYLDSDRDFARVEKVLRKHDTVYLPEQYRDLIRESSKRNHVTDMTNHFRDIHHLLMQLKLTQKRKNDLNEKVAFRDNVKWIRVDEFGSYLYKDNYDPYTPFKRVSILQNKQRRPLAEQVNFKRINNKTGDLSEKKKENLREQIKYVQEEFRWFYEEVLNIETAETRTRRRTN